MVATIPRVGQLRESFSPCQEKSKGRPRNFRVSSTVDGQHPFRTTLKPLFVGIYREIIIPGFRRCEMDFIRPQFLTPRGNRLCSFAGARKEASQTSGLDVRTWLSRHCHACVCVCTLKESQQEADRFADEFQMHVAIPNPPPPHTVQQGALCF